MVDSTHAECARSRNIVKRAALADAADYGSAAVTPAHSGVFGCTPICAFDGDAQGAHAGLAERDEREVPLALFARSGETLVGDKGYAGRNASGR